MKKTTVSEKNTVVFVIYINSEAFTTAILRRLP